MASDPQPEQEPEQPDASVDIFNVIDVARVGTDEEFQQMFDTHLADADDRQALLFDYEHYDYHASTPTRLKQALGEYIKSKSQDERDDMELQEGIITTHLLKKLLKATSSHKGVKYADLPPVDLSSFKSSHALGLFLRDLDNLDTHRGFDSYMKHTEAAAKSKPPPPPPKPKPPNGCA